MKFFACVALMLASLFFSFSLQAQEIGYYYKVNSDANGYLYADTRISEITNIPNYRKVYFDTYNRIVKVESYWKGALYSTGVYSYPGSKKEMQQLRWLGRAGEGVVKYIWGGQKLTRSESYDADNTMTSYTEFQRNGKVVESKTYKNGRLISHYKTVYRNNLKDKDYSEGNYLEDSVIKRVYSLNPERVEKQYQKWGNRDYALRTENDYDRYYRMRHSVSKTIRDNRKTSERWYENGLITQSINYQADNQRVAKYVYDQAEMQKGLKYYYGDKLVYTTQIKRAGNNSVKETVAFLPDGKVFAVCTGQVVNWFKPDGTPLYGEKCDITPVRLY